MSRTPENFGGILDAGLLIGSIAVVAGTEITGAQQGAKVLVAIGVGFVGVLEAIRMRNAE